MLYHIFISIKFNLSSISHLNQNLKSLKYSNKLIH
nr:MAG TPA: hypothetical protein [Caudoviricetes sp.]